MPAKIQISDLRHHVEITQQVLTPDEIGGAVATFASRGFVWAAIVAANGAERATVGRPEGSVVLKLLIRKGVITVTSTDVVIHEGKTLPVKYVNTFDPVFTELLVVEGDVP